MTEKNTKRCPHCNIGYLEEVEGREPWTIKHLMCNNCDSTYPIDYKPNTLNGTQTRTQKD